MFERFKACCGSFHRQHEGRQCPALSFSAPYGGIDMMTPSVKQAVGTTPV